MPGFSRLRVWSVREIRAPPLSSGKVSHKKGCKVARPPSQEGIGGQQVAKNPKTLWGPKGSHSGPSICFPRRPAWIPISCARLDRSRHRSRSSLRCGLAMCMGHRVKSNFTQILSGLKP